jgi:hypothetical protein
MNSSYSMGSENVGGLRRERLQLTPADLALVAAEVLPDHGELVAGVLFTDVRGDVVALRDFPSVGGTRRLVGADLRMRTGRRHGSPLVLEL